MSEAFDRVWHTSYKLGWLALTLSGGCVLDERSFKVFGLSF